MSDTDRRARQPKGVPSGGQFSAEHREDTGDIKQVAWRQTKQGAMVATHPNGAYRFILTPGGDYTYFCGPDSGDLGGREDGPAVNSASLVAWYRDGKLSRPLTEGPALVDGVGRCHYYVDGTESLPNEEDMVSHDVTMGWDGKLWLASAEEDFDAWRGQFKLDDPNDPWA